MTARELADILIDFVDRERLNTQDLTPDQVKKEFRRLHAAFRAGLALSNNENSLRNIDSLTSKALWCCYPTSVPILDDFAERALQILSRLQRSPLVAEGTRYERFVDAWFFVYEQVELSINLDSIDESCSKVKVLDSFLWWLGQNSFDLRTSSRLD